VDAQYTELKLPVDILIGTVPLREAFLGLGPQSDMVITRQPPSAPAVTENADFFDLRTPPSLMSRLQPRRLYILCWREHSRRKLSPTLATTYYSCPDNASSPM